MRKKQTKQSLHWSGLSVHVRGTSRSTRIHIPSPAGARAVGGVRPAAAAAAGVVRGVTGVVSPGGGWGGGGASGGGGCSGGVREGGDTGPSAEELVA